MTATLASLISLAESDSTGEDGSNAGPERSVKVPKKSSSSTSPRPVGGKAMLRRMCVAPDTANPNGHESW